MVSPLLLQVRMKVLDEEWCATVRRWHPVTAAEPAARAASPPVSLVSYNIFKLMRRGWAKAHDDFVGI